MEAAGPFGQGAPAPRFALPDCRIAHLREVGTGHLKITFGDGLGARIDGIAFGAMDGPLGAELTDYLQGNESAEKALSDVEAAYTTAAREAGFLQ